MSNQTNFDRESLQNIKRMGGDAALKQVSQDWINTSAGHNYVYNWKWLGLPIIQFPADIVVTQEIIWATKPTVIVETGVARGGSIIFNASQLALLDVCESVETFGVSLSRRRCIGIDIDIRSHTRQAVESHPLAPLVTLYEGSSTDELTARFVKEAIEPEDRVLVILDSDHSHEHVARELELYSPFVSRGSFLIVHDTGIEEAPEDMFANRAWGKGNNPMTAVEEFVAQNADFSVADEIGNKLLITSSPGGYLRRS